MKRFDQVMEKRYIKTSYYYIINLPHFFSISPQTYIIYSRFKNNVQYLQSNNNGQKVLQKHSWMVELTENEILVYNKVVHVNRIINNVIK